MCILNELKHPSRLMPVQERLNIRNLKRLLLTRRVAELNRVLMDVPKAKTSFPPLNIQLIKQANRTLKFQILNLLEVLPSGQTVLVFPEVHSPRPVLVLSLAEDVELDVMRSISLASDGHVEVVSYELDLAVGLEGFEAGL